jgi:glycerophosphoryl diester phosphodiesterase
VAVVPRRDLPRWVVDVPLAHRGLWSADVPENSLAAFAAARDAGVGAELDVHVTADGVPVVVHDVNLLRAAGVALDVRRQPLAAVREHALSDGSPVPTLVEVLEVLGDTPVMVEVKNHGRGAGVVEPPTARVLAAHGRRAYVASFHPGSLRWFRRHAPGVLRAQTASMSLGPRLPRPVGWALSRLVFANGSLPHLVSYDLAGIASRPVQDWRARGGAVVAWTVRGASDLERATSFADNVIFEGDPPVWPPAG